MSRTTNSLRNIKYALFGQFFGLLISFINRIVFTRVLSAEYLGINGLFSNIMSILSLAELGFGSAIVFSMYKPIAVRDEEKIKSLMYFYKKVYTIIGIIILIMGLTLAPFLNFFLKDIPNIPYLNYIFILFVLNTSISYFYSYKHSLIIADQKRYIVTIYRYILFFLLNILQIIILYLTHRYIFYLLLQIFFTFVENILVSRKADRLYPFINTKNTMLLDKNERKIIFRNVRAMMAHKFGAVIVKGTDNILISKFVGVAEVGIYSNYQLITNALNIVYSLLFDSLTASIGNLGVTGTKEQKKSIFNVINFIGFWIYGFSSISLFYLMNPFIKLWLGEVYNFDIKIVLIIVINFYLSGMRKAVLTYRTALGLFWYDRHKPLIEALINLIASITLVHKFGIAGVFIGTIISTITVCFWVEPYILYKYAFDDKPTNYFVRYILYTIVMLISGILVWYLTKPFNNGGFMSFIILAGICLTIPNVIFVLVFWNSKEFKYVFNLFMKTTIETFNKFRS